MADQSPIGPDRRSVALGLAATLVGLPLARAQPARTGSAQAAEEARILTAAVATHRMKREPAPGTSVWAYDSSVPGPLIRAKRSEEFRLTLANKLPQPTTLHWHGVRLPNAMDGVAGLTQEAVAPGASFDTRFTPKDGGTFWYRSLFPAHAAEQTERGLHGLFVVDEDKPPVFDQDLALVLDDFALDDIGDIRPTFGEPSETALAGRLGNWLTVNGRPTPETIKVAPGARLRLRIVNVTNARPLTLRFEALGVRVIAVDGQPTEPFTLARGTLSLVPGNRFDLAVDAPAKAGETGSIIAFVADGVPLLVVETDGPPSPLAGSPVAALPDNGLPQAIDLARAKRADLVIDGGLDPQKVAPGAPVKVRDPARIWRLNGVAWPDALMKPVLSVKAGAPVSLGFVNKTPFLQAMHVHGHHVRLLHRLDDGWEPYWLDTIAIQPGATARIAFVAETPGRWMIGSTVLERLGTGLAAWFEVT